MGRTSGRLVTRGTETRSAAVRGRAHEAFKATERLSGALESEGFAGRDPYDALSSPLLRRAARGRLARQVAIQALKRSPVDLRSLLRVPQQRHSKALALFVSAYVLLARLVPEGPYGRLARELARDLKARAVPRQGGIGFAYDFDVQTRWGYYRAGHPNAVATSFGAHALLDWAALDGDSEAVALARRTLDFAGEHLLREYNGERFFAYFDGSDVPIHNASVLIASVAARCGEPGSDRLDEAAGAVAYTLERQRSDGSWPYGEAPGLEWVDGYHTAYVLDALELWHGITGDTSARAAVDHGLDLYLERLVDPDGAARATLASRYPIETHAAASGIRALCRLTTYDERALPTADRIVDWALASLRRRDGRFAFRRTRLLRNTVPYIRWSDGHMLLALATYLDTKGAGGGG